MELVLVQRSHSQCWSVIIEKTAPPPHWEWYNMQQKIIGQSLKGATDGNGMKVVPNTMCN